MCKVYHLLDGSILIVLDRISLLRARGREQHIKSTTTTKSFLSHMAYLVPMHFVRHFGQATTRVHLGILAQIYGFTT